MKKIFLLPALLLLFFSVSAQWQSTGGPFGGAINDCCQTDGHFFAGTTNGIYHSTDGALNWEYCLGDLPPGLTCGAIGANSNGRVVAFCYDFYWQRRVLKSEDNGSSWTQLTIPDSASYYSSVLVLAERIIVYDYQRIWESTDGGVFWSLSIPDSLLNGADCVRAYNDLLYVGTHNGILTRELDGNDWSYMPLPGINGGVTDIFVRDSLIIASSNSKALRSINAGMDWQPVNTNTIYNSAPNLMQWRDGVIYGLSGGKVVRSVNSGETWEKLYPASSDAPYAGTFHFSGDILVVTSPTEGCQRSADFGLTFYPSNYGLVGTSANRVTWHNGYMYNAVNFAGLFGYNISASQWDTTNLLPVNYANGATISHSGYLFSTSDWTNEQILRSGDNGQTWQDVSPQSIDNVGCFYSKDASLFARLSDIGDAVYRTDNLGLSWTNISFPFQVYGTLVAFTPHGNSLIASENNKLDALYRSNDNGATWVPFAVSGLFGNPPLLTVTQLYSAGDLLFAVVGDSQELLFVSSDNGVNWTWAMNGLPPGGITIINDVSRFGDAILLATAYAGVFLSLDGGLHWAPFNEGLGATAVSHIVSDGQNLYCSSWGNGMWKRSLSDLNFEAVTGTIYRDDNNNGVQDAGEQPMPGVLVRKAGSQLFSSSDATGAYTLFNQFSGADTIVAISPSQYANVNPPFYTATGAVTDLHFGVHFEENVRNLCVEATNLTVFRPGFENTIFINFKNVGTKVESGEVRLRLDPAMEFVSAEPSPSGVIGDTSWWNFSNLQMFESRHIKVRVKINAGVPVGTVLNAGAEIHPVLNDVYSANNTDRIIADVIGSFDPNDKTVEPDNIITTQQIAEGEQIIYTIRFQNTGNYLAETVRIADQLDVTLNPATLQILASSHPCELRLSGTGFLEFIFNMINLPDSMANESESHGFVKFSIQANEELFPGTLIQNTAGIYFDFNAPVITNTVTTRVTALLNDLLPVSTLRKLVVYPNPNSGQFRFLLENEGMKPGELCVFDPNGRLYFRCRLSSGEELTLPDGTAPGLYTALFWTEGKKFAGKIMVLR